MSVHYFLIKNVDLKQAGVVKKGRKGKKRIKINPSREAHLCHIGLQLLNLSWTSGEMIDDEEQQKENQDVKKVLEQDNKNKANNTARDVATHCQDQQPASPAHQHRMPPPSINQYV